MFFKKNTNIDKLETAREEYIDLLAKKKQLEYEVKQIESEIKLKNLDNELKLKELSHQHSLEIKEKNMQMDRIGSIAQIDLIRSEEQLKASSCLQLKEEIFKIKMDAEKRIAQIELDQKVSESKMRSEMETEYYNKLKNALEELHTKGNVTTKFMQEIALKMFDRAPIMLGEKCKAD
jgi:hypothetical protein